MLRTIKYPLLLLALPVMAACSSGNEDEKTIASTHPKLEKQLNEDSLTTPVSYQDSSDLYHRYRITMEEYETDKNYSVQGNYSDTMTQLDLQSHPDAASFKTALENGMKEGVNYAGKYTVVTVGCGTACQQHFIVDRETGKVTDKVQSSLGAKFSANSRIFVVNPPDSTLDYSNCNNCTPEAYVLEGQKLRKLPYENAAAN